MMNRKMNGFFAYVLLVAWLSSCSNDRTRELPISDNANGDVKVVTIDSCEYIVWAGWDRVIGYAHKGNCKWCRLRQRCH
jgi:hypothetical protein